MPTRPVSADVQEPRYMKPLSTASAYTVLSTQATLTIAAGGAGVKHVADGFSFSLASNTEASLAASTIRISVIDGASGGTDYLWSHVLLIGSSGIAVISESDMGLVGTPNTAMTIEFDKTVSGAWESLNLSYFDIGP